ncbi:hypothetical protein F5Y12DRAFT_712462 [Xylaria sp. FL1777]|nr:hypothetical protein F5Y12DRAFT_712462 [Xylaria sp. FL1777]
MYIIKLIFPALLVLPGLAQASPLSGEGLIEIENANLPSKAEDLSVPRRDEPDSSDPDDTIKPVQELNVGAPDPNSQNPPLCPPGEYFDPRLRRCLRIDPLPRPQCPRGQQPYCGRGIGDQIPYATTPIAGETGDIGRSAMGVAGSEIPLSLAYGSKVLDLNWGGCLVVNI